MLKWFSNLLAKMRANDPVHVCTKYQKEGCAHVDGFLCDVQTCSIRKRYDEGHQKT
jgi:hypothetical protein